MFQKLHDKIRLFFRKEKEPFLSLYKILGFCPGNMKYYEEALRHRSYRSNGAENGGSNNERLEFLGDAVLGAVVADILFRQYPKEHEGYLTNLRSKLVKRESLNKLAVQIGLDKLVKHSNKLPSTHNSYMNGNAFEAFIGALYLDQGYGRCMEFIADKILSQKIDVDEVAQKEENFKSRIIEWCQKYQLECKFNITEEKQDKQQNAVKFFSEVQIEGIVCGRGSGFSKKESHQKASKAALKKLTSDVPFVNTLFEIRNKRQGKQKS